MKAIVSEYSGCVGRFVASSARDFLLLCWIYHPLSISCVCTFAKLDTLQ